MVRRLVSVLMAAFLAAALLPATVAAAGPGAFLHGGKPTADVTVQCALNGYDYDVLATINPDLVVEAVTNGIPEALAWETTSNKASAFSIFLDELYTGALLDTNIVFGQDLWGEGYPFTWVRVQFGYWNVNLEQFIVLGSGVGKCKPGDFNFE